MARSTYKTFLMDGGTGTSASFGTTPLIDIKDFPDLGGEPEMLETTTLSNKMQTYIPGIQSLDALTFTANYDLAKYNTLKSTANYDGVERWYGVWFGGTESNGSVTPTGSEGKFVFKGQLSVYANGAGVNEVTEMTISIAPSTDIQQTATTGA